MAGWQAAARGRPHVMSNIGLERYLGARKLKMVRAPVGDRTSSSAGAPTVQFSRRAVRHHHDRHAKKATG